MKAILFLPKLYGTNADLCGELRGVLSEPSRGPKIDTLKSSQDSCPGAFGARVPLSEFTASIHQSTHVPQGGAFSPLNPYGTKDGLISLSIALGSTSLPTSHVAKNNLNIRLLFTGMGLRFLKRAFLATDSDRFGLGLKGKPTGNHQFQKADAYFETHIPSHPAPHLQLLWRGLRAPRVRPEGPVNPSGTGPTPANGENCLQVEEPKRQNTKKVN